MPAKAGRGADIWLLQGFFEEVAKFRAARRMWYRIMGERFGAKDERSKMLRFHTQTAGSMLTAQQPENNVVRVAVQSLAAVLGGTQSLHTNGFDEALGLPTERAAKIALRTQQIIAYESGVTETVDPLAGSYFVESLTNEVEAAAWKYIERIDELGGAVAAIEAGYMQDEIEKAAFEWAKAVDGGEKVIVGVNKYRLAQEPPVDVREIDNTEVRRQQIARLEHIKATRDAAAVESALTALRNGAAADGNLLALCIDAARARATVGEMSQAMEDVFGRHRASVRTLSGVWGSAYDGDEGVAKIRAEIDEFAASEGRRPRMLVAKLGQDGHDRGAKVIATAFADLGFDIDVGPLFQTPAEAARDAIENDVHLVGISSQAAGHKTLVPQLIAELQAQGANDVLVVVGGVIPSQDYDYLREAGVAAIFGPGTNIPEAAAEILQILRTR
mgnify:CR=1 FL=1